MVAVSGLGSWPGEDVREALRVVRGELAGTLPEGLEGIPYLPELPARGPGADMVGRTAGLLVDMPVDVQPQGWRLVDRPGRDAERTAALWRQDLDELAETFDGWAGQLKVQVAGPWTLASELWLPLGDRVLDDAGAVRDLADSLAEGLRLHVGVVQRLVPGAQLVVQLDEPSLTAVLAGHIRSGSGYRTLPAPDSPQAQTVLTGVIQAARSAGATAVVVHCCAGQPPVDLLRDAGPEAVSVDTAMLGTRGWESVAAAVEAGVRLWAGAVPAGGGFGGLTGNDGGYAAELVSRWDELGLGAGLLHDVTVTPSCGLANASPDQARRATSRCVEVARDLAEAADR